MIRITIDGQDADITLENERTIGDVLAGLEQWLRGSGYRLSGLEVDGETADSRSLDRFFGQDLAAVEILNIKTSSWAEHAVQSIVSLHGVLRALGDLAFREREGLYRDWEAGPEAQFIKAEFPELYAMTEKTFAGEGIPPGELEKVLEERLREFESPRRELEGSGSLVEALAQRLRDLPLDIQTGKDSRAAETMGIFSTLAEKLFRLFNLLRIGGNFPENLTVEGSPVKEFIGEFDAAVKELIQAYEGRDTVLVGDLAEYELAPRLLRFYAAINT
ncbi:MAG: hypothetical protein LBH51_05440 [Treponema sp.]|jgi:hypothetical protein|nr:hypothetical protein [Treponema sp.]